MNGLRCSVYRWVLWGLVWWGVGWGSSHVMAQWLAGNTPTRVSLQATVSGPMGPVNGVFPITIQLYEGNVDNPQFMVGNSLTFESVRFVGGLVSLVVDIQSMVNQTTFANLRDPYIKLMVNNDGYFVPLYAVPYAIQSRTADVAKKVAASGITGVFANFLVNKSLIVGPVSKPYFKVDEGRVGINVSNILPAATLDVGGIVNATGYRVDGQDIDVALLWAKTPGNANSIYYDSGPNGFVGVGLTEPRYMLDVQGTVNASAYTVNDVPLDQYLQGVLAWSQEGGRIYRLGDVGIGLTNPSERLDVAGAIRLGASKNPNTAKPGTIEYRVDSVSGRGDFRGYNGSKWVSLTADQAEGEANALSYWSVTDRLESTAKNGVGVWWDPDQFRFGVGPKSAMDSVFTIQASGATNLMSVKTNLGQPIFYVSNSNVGIATNTPGAAYKLDVNGIVNAKTIYVQGRPLELSMSSDSYWLLENNGRIFYDRGRVGIGTSTPMNLLEISSASGESAIGFGRQNTRFFTMGISDQAPDSFIIAVSGNLNVPVFAFKNQNIGIGLSNPKANFHVSGNSGVVIKGPFGETSGFTESGPGAKLFWFPGKAAFRAGLVKSMAPGTGDYRWDVNQLGDYSVGIGYNPLVKGRYAVGLGGLDNQATGEGSVALGGISNSATGAYSFAAGYQALAAHPGSFVWADYTPSANVYFSSNRANQFLVRAVGGVGIGTANTTRAMLTISNPNRAEYVLGAFGVNQLPAMVVTTSGNVGIGVTDPGTATLAFASDARFGIGTTQPSASLTVVQSAGTNRDFLRLTKQQVDGTQSPVFIVNQQGNVGIGLEPDNTAPAATILVAGGVVASEYKMVVQDEGQAKVVEIQPYSSPWADPAANAGNTSYSLGYVGIGTPEPNNLLELSNRSALADGTSLGLLPRLSFDVDGQDQFVLALVTASVTPTDYLLGILSGAASQPIVTVSDTGLGINIGAVRPSASLHVSGNMRVSRVWVGNPDPVTGFNSSVPLVVKGRMDTDELYLNGVRFIPASSPWLQSGSDIYVNRNVGIGVSNPLSALHVAGVIRTEGLWVTNPVTFANRFSLSQLSFLDQQVPNQFGQLRVMNGELQYVNAAGLIKEISSTLTRGSGNSGVMAYFVNDSTIGMSGVRWDGPTDTLSVSGSMQLVRSRATSGLSSETSMGFGGTDKGFSIQSALVNEGDAAQAQSYVLADYLMTVNSTWGSSTTPVDLTGINLKLSNAAGTYVLNGSRVVGLSVDVSGVKLDAQGTGLAYAALFNGGNVGIGTTRPSVALEVIGTVSANYFNLRGGLDVPELRVNAGRVNNPLFVAKSREVTGGTKARIGIGVSQPELTDYELSVAGAVSVNSLLVSGGLVATTLNIGSNYNLVIDDEGEIGIGVSQPDSQLSVKKTLQSAADVTNEGIAGRFDTVIDGAKQAGSVFYYDRDINGLLITLSSGTGSNLSSVGKGLNIDLTNLAVNTFPGSEAKAYGLYVDVTGTGDRVAAAFMGGNVGIGTATPEALLDVKGAIKANNLIISGTLDARDASVTVNQLSVVQSMDLRGALLVDSMVVNRELTVNRLVLQGGLSASAITANTLRVTLLKVTDNLTLAGTLIGETASINTVRVGTLNVGSGTAVGALVVSGNTVLDQLTVLNGVTVVSGTMNINANQWVVTPLGNVGIGTATPSSRLHVAAPPLGAYVDTTPQTWAPLVIQSAGGAGTAAGMLFSTDATVSGVAPDSGAGFAAVRGSGMGDDTGTSLVFLTDPGVTGSRPLERFRITSKGRVGIGVTNPDVGVSLHVSGSMYVSATLNANALSVQRVLPPEDGSVLTISGNRVQFDARAEFLKGVTANQGVYLGALDSPVGSVTHGLLYVNRADSDLYFLPPNSATPVNLSSIFIGPPTRIPVLGATGRISANSPLSWVDATQTLIIGTLNQRTDVSFIASFNAAVSGTVPFLSVQSLLPDYTGGSGVSAIGTQIMMQGEGSVALGPNDVAIGLSVDVSGLSSSRVSNGAVSMGRKYAATFMGGHVGIGLTEPKSMLHVKQSGDLPLMRLDSATDSARFISVSSMGQWGINTDNATALLAIQAPASWSRPLVWVGGSGGTYWVVTGNGNVGIGVSNPQVKLDVQGGVKATSGYFDLVSANRLTVGTGFVVTANGFVGIGTSNPTALLSVARSVTSTQFNSGDANYLGNTFSLMRLLFELRDNTPGTTRSYRGNVRGLDIVLDSGTATFGSAEQTTSVVGLSLDATQLRATDETVPVTGLQVDVSGSGGTRYAALLMGGNVGIGTANPAFLLDVAGDIRAQGLQLSGSVSANAVTLNQLVVNTDMLVKGVISTNVLIANTVQTDQLVLTTKVQSAEASFVTLNAGVGVMNKLLVGSVSNPSLATMVVSGDVWIAGGVTVNALSTALITAPTGLTITGSGTLVVPTLSVLGQMRVTGSVGLITQSGDPTDLSQALLYAKGERLWFRPPGLATTPIDLQSFSSGSPGKVAYFSNAGTLASLESVSWDQATQMLTLGAMSLSAPPAITGDFIGSSVTLPVVDRRTGSAGQLVGLGIDMVSEAGGGRLAHNDVAIGLKVDVSALQDVQTDGVGVTRRATKLAAAFMGGRVGIGTTLPDAALHVSPNAGVPGLLVGPSIAGAQLIVDALGRVGVGTGVPSASFTVVGRAGDTHVMWVQTSAGAPVWVANENQRVGIGKTDPSVSLDVAGGVAAESALVDTVSVNRLVVGGEWGVVVSGNRMGVGGWQPGVALSVSSNMTLLDSNPATLLDISRTIYGSTVPGITYQYGGPITGINLKLDNQAAFTGTANGLVIDMGTLTAARSLTGLSVQVGPAQVAAYFEGSVGVGVTPNAGVALQVSGNATMDALSVSGTITTNRLTATTMTGTSATVDYLVVTDMVADRVSVNTLVVSTLNVASVLYDQATVNMLTVERMAVARPDSDLSNSSWALDVNGVSRLNGSVEITGSVSANHLAPESGNTITLNATLVAFESPRLTSTVLSAEQYVLMPTSNNAPESGALWVSGNNQLYFKSATTLYPLSESIKKTPHRVAFYGADGLLTDSSAFGFDGTTLSLGESGASSPKGQFRVAGTVANADTSYTAHRVSVQIPDRTMGGGDAAVTVKGLDIVFDPPPGDTARLKAGEVATGLMVDLRKVYGEYTQTGAVGDGAAKAYKSAALFMGGAVGIGTTQPTALLDVVATNEVPFQVKKDATVLLVVSQNGNVGVGTGLPTARLTVEGTISGGAADLFQVSDGSALPTHTMVVKISGDALRVGIGTTNPQAMLHIATVNGLPSFMIGVTANPVWVVSGNMVGIGGIPSPAATLHVTGDMRVDAGGEHTLLVRGGKMGVGVSDPLADLHVKSQVVIGQKSSDDSAPSGSFKGLAIRNSSNEMSVGFDGVNPTITVPTSFVLETSGGSPVTLATFDTSGLVVGSTSRSGGDTSLLYLNDNARDLLRAVGSATDVMVVKSDHVVVGGGSRAAGDTTSKLSVNGTMSVTGDVNVSGTLTAETLSSKELTVSKTYPTAPGADTTVHTNELKIDADLSQPVTALKVSLGSNRYDALDRNYSLWKGATGIGLVVDVASLATNAVDTISNRVAALFTGGRVGIGTTAPESPLDVRATEEDVKTARNPYGVTDVKTVDLLHMRSADGVGLKLRAMPETDATHWMVYNRAGQDPYSVLSMVVDSAGTPRLGIGIDPFRIDTLDKALVVNGDVRLGVVSTTAPASPVANPGKTLLFSGGPVFSAGKGSENGSELSVYRYNKSDGVSELRMGWKELKTGDTAKLAIGSGEGATFKPYLTVNEGNVVISDGGATNTASIGRLAVYAERPAVSSTLLEQHGVLFHNTGGNASAHVLGLRAEPPASVSTVKEVSFVSFFGKSGSADKRYGYISGTYSQVGGGSAMTGVKFVTTAADYAEYVRKAVSADRFVVGDVLGVTNGLVSRQTDKAQVVLVRSYAATVAGNMPPSGQEDQYELVAFLGQVKVRVVGPVVAGEWVVASGLNDGTAIAVATDRLLPAMLPLVVGIAWETNQDPNEKLVLAAVGGPFSTPSAAIGQWVNEAKQTLTEAKKAQATFEADVTRRLESFEAKMKAFSGR